MARIADFYPTPHGQDESKLRDGTWPVWEETVLSLGRKERDNASKSSSKAARPGW